MEENRELNEPKAISIIAKDFGNGSGFFVQKDLIATNIHVVAGATSISARIDANTTYTIEGVAAFDAKNDLVILKIADKGTPLPIGNSDLVQKGDLVRAKGYPNGKYEVIKGAIHSIRDNDKWIRMKIKTISGNSGSPVLNVNGEVIGVSVGGSDFYSFAIPANAVKILLTQAQEIESLAQWKEKDQIRAYACLVQSKTKHEAGNYNEAIVDLDKAIRLYPDYFLFYDNRGVAHRFVGQSKVKNEDLAEAQQHYQDAIADYTKAIKLCPDYALAYINRGTTQSDLGQSKTKRDNVTEAQQHYQDAIADYTKAIKLCPDYTLAYNDRADAKCHLGKSEDVIGNVEAAQSLYQEAIIDINTAIELNANIAIFYHTRGEIMYALGEYNAAIEDYERAREKDPDYTDVCKDLELAKEALERQIEEQAKD